MVLIPDPSFLRLLMLFSKLQGHSHDTAVKFLKLSEALREWPYARQFGMPCQQEEGEGKGQMTAVQVAGPANSRIIGIYSKPISKCR